MSKENIDFESFCNELRNNPQSRALFDRYYQPLFEFADDLIHHPRSAEKMIADVFRQLKIDNFSSFDQLKEFLFREVLEHCKNFVKATDLWEAMNKKKPLDEEAIMEGMLFQQLYDSAQELPKQRMRVIHLLFFCE